MKKTGDLGMKKRNMLMGLGVSEMGLTKMPLTFCELDSRDCVFFFKVLFFLVFVCTRFGTGLCG